MCIQNVLRKIEHCKNCNKELKKTELGYEHIGYCSIGCALEDYDKRLKELGV